MTDSSIQPDVGVKTGEAGFGDYFALLKPRVMPLSIFTAFVGMVVAPGGVHPFIGFVAVLCIAVGAGAAGALNMWWDSDIDAIMRRTRNRPIPAGRVQRGEALGLGLTLASFAVVMLYLATNWVAAALLAFTIFFYVVIYSIWIKRRTPQNIVIGGAAGAFPPMVGWAVVTGGVSLESMLLFMLIFMWTPPHFWALDLFVKGDYANARVPMMTATRGQRATRNHILAYAILLVPFALAVAFTSIGGPAYLLVSLWLNVRFVLAARTVWLRNEADSVADNYAGERKLFRLSLSYLFLHFGVLLLEAVLRGFGIDSWAFVIGWF
ncbi:putative protoheme IX farnesyltransferase [Ketogulonicigenium robustum]|uniref:Protoheme IX farnesyltransferase n=1 Tax=Ketogulonicigenium robustum TaxID=92947 RepID=A0A1W6NY24_9RHOB|nr:heme o synthase [Ketogulonicigenium robustum]ARO13917.1 putative protoheme IX farnesyltransferase [Ketogulonicigenium robustum]